MKIAVIAPTYLPARRANTIQTMKMAQAFSEAGHAVRVFVPGQDPLVGWDELAGHYGLQTKFEMRWLPVVLRFKSYDYGWRAVWAAKFWGADVLFTRLPQGAALGSWLNIPTILEAHDLPQGEMGARLFQWYLNGRSARRLVSISQSLSDDLKANFKFPEKDDFELVAPDGVDLDRYKDLPDAETARETLEQPQQFTVGYTGHLYAGRGIELIMELADFLPDVHFLLAGGNPEDVNRLMKKAPENMTFTGFVPNAELPLYQAACDVLLMPYQARVAASSGGDIGKYLSPMKMFEYLAAGRVIASSDLPVLGEVLHDGKNALILPGDDPEAWAHAIVRVQNDAKLRRKLGKKAKKTAAHYSWVNRTERILENIIR